jgi:uncharacterized protein YkwD
MQPIRRQSRTGLVLVAAATALVALGFSPLSGGALDIASPVPVEAASPEAVVLPLNTGAAERTLLDLTNADRLQNGLPTLDLDLATQTIARERASSQLSATSLSHYDGSGQLVFVGLLSQAGVDYQLAGENLARSSGGDDSSNITQRVEQALMQSPTHRKNILEQTFTRVSIGAATDDQGHIAFAEIFRAE